MTAKSRLRARCALWATVVGLVFGLGCGIASAVVTVTPGWTFSVASPSGLPLTGTHYHDDHLGAFGNPPNLAEVGSLQDQALSSEECRGLTEFNLAGLTAGTATLSFSVQKLGGLFPGQNDHPFTGNIGVLAYTGNNADDIGDYSISASPVGTFATAPLLIGSVINFNVTSLYNAQLLAASPSMGFRLQTTPSTVTSGGAFTFESFTLTVTPVPEPLSLASFVAISAMFRRPRRIQL